MKVNAIRIQMSETGYQKESWVGEKECESGARISVNEFELAVEKLKWRQAKKKKRHRAKVNELALLPSSQIRVVDIIGDGITLPNYENRVFDISRDSFDQNIISLKSINISQTEVMECSL